jgi:uncharacterized protein (TIGR00645 family)
MFAARWLLYPVNCGLLVVLVLYLLRFLFQVAQLLRHAQSIITEGTLVDDPILLLIVNLLDKAMITSLLILTIMGGHQIYIRRFRSRSATNIPQWLDHIDTITLKVKLGLAFTGVSSVTLLEDCVSQKILPKEVWIQHIVIHLVFVGTTLIMAIVWRLMYFAHNDKGENTTNQNS